MKNSGENVYGRKKEESVTIETIVLHFYINYYLCLNRAFHVHIGNKLCIFIPLGYV